MINESDIKNLKDTELKQFCSALRLLANQSEELGYSRLLCMENLYVARKEMRRRIDAAV